jgi:DNA-binding transcriptional ArsR family regulator
MYYITCSIVGVSRAGSDAVRSLSKAVFGQELRIAVMVAIGESDGLFTLTNISERLGLYSPSLIQAPLKSLEAAGLIERMDRVDSRSVHFRRNDASSAWKFASELFEQATREVQPSVRD